MTNAPTEAPLLLFWTGPKHSGKTTALRRAVRIWSAAGLHVRGIVAPALYRQGELAGFDLIDLATHLRRPLLRPRLRTDDPAAPSARPSAADATSHPCGFLFHPEGLRAGRAALDPRAAAAADLLVLDEFGPIELHGGGWHPSLERLLPVRTPILLVVRAELLDAVRTLYARLPHRLIIAAASTAVSEVQQILCH